MHGCTCGSCCDGRCCTVGSRGCCCCDLCMLQLLQQVLQAEHHYIKAWPLLWHWRPAVLHTRHNAGQTAQFLSATSTCCQPNTPYQSTREVLIDYAVIRHAGLMCVCTRSANAVRGTKQHHPPQSCMVQSPTCIRAASPAGVCCGISGRIPLLMTARAASRNRSDTVSAHTGASLAKATVCMTS